MRMFIPNRSAMDFDYAHYMLTEGRKRKEKENTEVRSPSSEAYQKLLVEIFGMNRRILAFKNKPPTPVEAIPSGLFSTAKQSKPVKVRRIPQSPARMLDAPSLLDDYYLNLLDWGVNNLICIALGNVAYSWNPCTSKVTECVEVDDETGPVTSVKWSPDGRYIAVGLNNSNVILWDSEVNQPVRALIPGHQSRVGALDWNNHILTTGGMDGRIIHNDVRVGHHVVATYRGHSHEVCGLKWSSSGWQLASGGKDNLLHIYDRSMVSSGGPRKWLHRLESHRAAVKALAWCPYQKNVLASGGGIGDECIKFWNSSTGAHLNSIDTGSEVCALLWNKNERELLSSHGEGSRNQLTLWKYPSMVKVAELTGPESRALFMAESPNGCSVASAAADETLRIWDVFGDPEHAKLETKAKHPEPFSHVSCIR